MKPISNAIPRLETIDGQLRLIVDEQPFLVLGGEFHNSSASTPAAIRRAFASLRGRNFNTVLAPVTWELVEPAEGRFDFGLVDELLATARAEGFRLIPLWFGAWKNGASPYVPSWVQQDQGRFPRAHLATTMTPLHLSPFGEETRSADAAAFAALMHHLAKVDSEHHTVIMVQVENEVGLLGDSRDRSPVAQAVFTEQVPDAVFDALERHPVPRLASAWRERGSLRHGTWAQVFGESDVTDEAFMAMAYASHIDAVAAAGKAEWAVPMIVNAWLDSEVEIAGLPAGGLRPGIYPSGGPLPQVAALYRQFAPSIDLLSPDIYFGAFDDICRRYREASGGLFIPEMRRDAIGAGNTFLAVGTHGAIGTSPFGVDSTDVTERDPMSDSYRLLAAVSPLVHAFPTAGVHLDEDRPETEVRLGDLVVTASREVGPGWSPRPVERGYGIVILIEPGVVVAAGRGLHLTLCRHDGASVELLRTEELSGVAPSFAVERVLNGDETLGGTTLVLHSLDPLPPSEFPIPGPERRVGLIRCRVHSPGGQDDEAGNDDGVQRGRISARC